MEPQEEAARKRRPKYERELANFVTLTQDLAEKRTVWSSRPYYLEYSTNSACNLRCIMCSQVENPPVISTPLELQGPFLDELFEHTTLLTPSATSEPLLNNMKRLLPLCEEQGVWLDIITNGMLLKPEVLEDMLPRLHRLTLSIDSHEKAIFERLRTPAVFETVVEYSKHAIARCNEVGVPVVIHMVLAHECLPGLEDFVDFVADELGAKHITVLELLENSYEFEALDPFQREGEAGVAAALERMRVRAEARGVSVLFEVHGEMGAQYDYGGNPTRITSANVLELMQGELAAAHAGFCPMVMNYFKVEPDGRAYPCCRAPHELELGNVFDEGGVDAVWNGPAMQSLREKMYARDYPAPCVGCVVLDAPRWRAEMRARDEGGESESSKGSGESSEQ